MSRFITLAAIAILGTNAFAQDAPLDPVERMTKDVIRRFMPSADLQTPRFDSRRFTAESRVEDESTGFGNASSRAFSSSAFKTVPVPHGTADRMASLEQQAPAFSLRSLFNRSMIRTEIEPWTLPSQVSLQPSQMSAFPAIRSDNDEPRPLSFSRASVNGVNAVQAIIPSQKGPQKVELKGTRRQMETQMDSLTPDVRRIMNRAMGF